MSRIYNSLEYWERCFICIRITRSLSTLVSPMFSLSFRVDSTAFLVKVKVPSYQNSGWRSALGNFCSTLFSPSSTYRSHCQVRSATKGQTPQDFHKTIWPTLVVSLARYLEYAPNNNCLLTMKQPWSDIYPSMVRSQFWIFLRTRCSQEDSGPPEAYPLNRMMRSWRCSRNPVSTPLGGCLPASYTGTR